MAWPAIAASEHDADSPITTNWGADVVDRTTYLKNARGYLRKPAIETVTNSAVLQDDDHLAFAVAANQTWSFEIYLLITTSHNDVDFRFNFTSPAGSTWRCFYWFYDINPAIPVFAGGVGGRGVGSFANGGADGTPDWSGAQTGAPGVIKGWIENGVTADGMTLQWAQRAAVAGQTTDVLAGSYLVLHQDHASF